jgi:hypothetical protein
MTTMMKRQAPQISHLLCHGEDIPYKPSKPI